MIDLQSARDPPTVITRDVKESNRVRSRSVRGLPIALVAGLVVTVSSAGALAASFEPAPTPVGRAVGTAKSTAVASGSSAAVTLPTGERVRLTGKPGAETVFILPAANGERGGPVITRHEGGHTYVMPAVAEPYLGRFLDQSLFDVTSLSAAAGKGDRLPIQASYRGAAPAVPGVAITAVDGRVAKGYLTRASSATFGRALTAQWKADSAAGWPDRTSLFTGLTKLSVEGSSPPAVVRSAAATAVMRTLTITTIAPDGLPEAQGSVSLINVDDARRYNEFVKIVDGKATVSVPEGTYSLQGDHLTYNQAAGTFLYRLAAVNEFKVTKANQTVAIDYRTATVEPTVTVPKEATLSSWNFTWYRADAKKNAGLNLIFALDRDTRMLFAPTKAATVGALRAAFSWELVEPVAVPTYVYHLAVLEMRLPATGQYAFTDAQLTPVTAAYFGEGPPRTAGFGRAPIFGKVGTAASLQPLPRGTRRAEYVGALGGNAVWSDFLISNYGAWDDGYVFTRDRPYVAGVATRNYWLKGPLTAAIPLQGDGGWCFGCRAYGYMYLHLTPFVDSSLAHRGTIRHWAEDGVPVTRFRLYRNDALMADVNDYRGQYFDVPKKKSTYRVVFDVDRRMVDPVQSTRTKTELTFRSREDVGKKLPSKWECAIAEDCLVLPIVQAQLSLPLGINGTLPAGKSTVTVTVAQVQNATKSPITSAGLEIRPVGGAWKPVKLTSIGGGKYQGVVNNAGLSGTQVDVRYSGADQAGSRAKHTVLRAYTVAE